MSASYPWFVVLEISLLPIAAILIAWKRHAWKDLLEKMAPPFLFHVALAFALVLVESTWALWTIIFLAGLSAFLVLELLFLLSYQPTAYPVNALSRLNIAFVPLILWYAVSTSIGLHTFLHTPSWVHVVMLMALGGVLFRTTGHPGASLAQNRSWMLIGVLVGAQVGWLGLLLPLSMPMQGMIAAIIMTGFLRVRRYLYPPKPSLRVAWSELVATCILFVMALSTTKWL